MRLLLRTIDACRYFLYYDSSKHGHKCAELEDRISPQKVLRWNNAGS
jgi:hypothetical protein